MDGISETSFNLEDYICSIEEDDPVLPHSEPQNIDYYLKLAKQNNENTRIHTIMDVWKGQQPAERLLRQRYANCFMWFLGLQLLILNIIFVLIGIGNLKYEQWTVNIFIISVFGEIVGIVSIIVKNLFKSVNQGMIDLIKGQK